MEVYIGEKFIGTITEEAFPAFYYVCNEWGFQINLNQDEGKVVLLSGLMGQQIFIFTDPELEQGAMRKELFERQILDAMKQRLLTSGVDMESIENQKNASKSGILLSLNVFQLPLLNQPVIELYHGTEKHESKKWIELIRRECHKAGVKPIVHELDRSEDSHTIKVNIMCPQMGETSFLEQVGERLVHILSIGLLSKLQHSLELSPLSIFPLEAFIPSLKQNTEKAQPVIAPPESEDKAQPVPIERFPEPFSSAEAYFDYHLLVGEAMKSAQVFGILTIKNNGSTSLKNPYVCFRVTPAGSVNITGQILPPSTAKVQGVQTVDGTKGWMFMSDNWVEEAFEKGEYWVSPIQEVVLAPGEIITMSNLQMKVTRSQSDKQIKVEAFVFFTEDHLEIAAHNKISLMIKTEQA